MASTRKRLRFGGCRTIDPRKVKKNSSEAPPPFALPPDGNNARVRPVARGIEQTCRGGCSYPEGSAAPARRRTVSKVQDAGVKCQLAFQRLLSHLAQWYGMALSVCRSPIDAHGGGTRATCNTAMRIDYFR
jgi:hypothetical protein